MANKPIQFRLTDDDLARLEFIAGSLGLTSRADAMRVAVTAEADRRGFRRENAAEKNSGKKSKNLGK